MFFGDDSLQRARQRSITRASGDEVAETAAAWSLAEYKWGWFGGNELTLNLCCSSSERASQGSNLFVRRVSCFSREEIEEVDDEKIIVGKKKIMYYINICRATCEVEYGGDGPRTVQTTTIQPDDVRASTIINGRWIGAAPCKTVAWEKWVLQNEWKSYIMYIRRTPERIMNIAYRCVKTLQEARY